LTIPLIEEGFAAYDRRRGTTAALRVANAGHVARPVTAWKCGDRTGRHDSPVAAILRRTIVEALAFTAAARKNDVAQCAAYRYTAALHYVRK